MLMDWFLTLATEDLQERAILYRDDVIWYYTCVLPLYRSVSNACNNLVPPDELVSTAVDVRQELDLRIGAAFTRLQTLRLQKVFPEALEHQLISFGSCQFPTLGFVVERYKQVEAFIPEAFYKIRGRLNMKALFEISL